MAQFTREGIQNMRSNKEAEIFRQDQIFVRMKPSASKINTLQCTKYLYTGLRILGIYMPEHHKIPYIIYSIAVNAIVTVFQPFAYTMTFLRFADTESEVGRWLTSFQAAIDIYACAIKIIIMAFMIKKLRVADAVMEHLDARCHQVDEVAQLHKLSRLTRSIVKLFAFLYWSYATITCLSAVLFGHPPYALYLPYIDWRRSQTEFVAASLIEYCLMGGICFQQVCCDSYGVIYVYILRTHMQILFMRLRKLAADKKMSAEQNMQELKLCVMDHKLILELFNIIAPAISLTIFVQFMVTGCIIGVTLINILIFAADKASIIASCVYIFAVSCETFPLCYYAQCLIEDSNKLAEEIFHSNWIDQNPKYGKMLAFFMQHTQRSMEMTAGKLFPIRLSSFVNIAKFSFSLYTFIRKMDIKKRIGQT